MTSLSVAPLDLSASGASTFQVVLDWIESNFAFLAHVLAVETRLIRTKVALTYISVKIQPRLRHITAEMEAAKNNPAKLSVLRKQFAGYADLHKRIRALRCHVDATNKALLTAVDVKKQAEIDVLTNTFEADIGAFSRALQHHNRLQFSFELAMTLMDKRKLTVAQRVQNAVEARANKPGSAQTSAMQRVLSQPKIDKLMQTAPITSSRDPSSKPLSPFSGSGKTSSVLSSGIQRRDVPHGSKREESSMDAPIPQLVEDPLGSPLAPVREFSTRGSNKSWESNNGGSRPPSGCVGQQQQQRGGSAVDDPDVDSRPVTRGRTPTPTSGFPVVYADIPHAVIDDGDGGYEDFEEQRRPQQQLGKPAYFNGLKGLTPSEIAAEKVDSLFPYKQPSRSSKKVVDPWEERKKGQLFISSILKAGPDGVINGAEFGKLKQEARGSGPGGTVAIAGSIRISAPAQFAKAGKSTQKKKTNLLEPLTPDQPSRGGGTRLAHLTPPPFSISTGRASRAEEDSDESQPICLAPNVTSALSDPAMNMKFVTRKTILRGTTEEISAALGASEVERDEEDIVGRLLPGFRTRASR